MDDKIRQYPEGYFIGKWMGIGIFILSGIGIPLAMALNLSWLIIFAPAMGILFGLAIGSSIESKHKKEGKIRPLTEDEIKKRKILWAIGLVLFLVVLIIFILRLFI